MTAIDPPQLRKQVDNLVQHYADPEKFLRDLRDLFNYYGDRTKRVSQHSAKTTALPASYVPQPVLRQIVVGLLPYAENVPHAILVLARSL